MKAVPSDSLPIGDGWIFEVKWDGYRTLAVVEGGTTHTYSSTLKESTGRWGPLFDGFADHLHALSAVIDGEVVALDEQSRPSFQALQVGRGSLRFVAFDLLAMNGVDLLAMTLEQRRHLLAEVLDETDDWQVPEAFDDGEALMAGVVANGLEGVVAKRRASPYQPGRRSPMWRKVKHRLRQELVVGGWQPGEGNRASSFGSLLVGVHAERGGGQPLRFAGAVGTGFDQPMLEAWRGRLDELAVTECPFDPPPTRAVTRTARWVHPVLVVEVAFAEWTDDGILRQPALVGWRDDKDPDDVVRET